MTHHTTHYLASPAWLHSPQTQRWCCREGAGHRQCRSDPQPNPYLASPAWLHSPQTQRWCCREGAGHRQCRSDPQPSPDQTPPTRRPQASCRKCCTWTSSAPLRDPRSVVPPPATHLVLSLQLQQNSPATSHHCLQHIWYHLYNWNRTSLPPLTTVCNTSGTVSTTETELPCYLSPSSATHLVLSLQLKQNFPATSHHCLQHMYPTMTLQLKQNPRATSHHSLQYTYLTLSLQLKQNSLLSLVTACNTSGTVSTRREELLCWVTLLPAGDQTAIAPLQVEKNSLCWVTLLPAGGQTAIVPLQVEKNSSAGSRYCQQEIRQQYCLYKWRRTPSAGSRYCQQEVRQQYCLYKWRRTPSLGHIIARRSDVILLQQLPKQSELHQRTLKMPMCVFCFCFSFLSSDHPPGFIL